MKLPRKTLEVGAKRLERASPHVVTREASPRVVMSGSGHGHAVPSLVTREVGLAAHRMAEGLVHDGGVDGSRVAASRRAAASVNGEPPAATPLAGADARAARDRLGDVNVVELGPAPRRASKNSTVEAAERGRGVIHAGLSDAPCAA